MSSSGSVLTAVGPLQVRRDTLAAYGDVFTPAALAAIEALAPFDRDRVELMRARTARRAARAAARTPIGFLDANAIIPRTGITVADARAGRFDGADIPADLERQWIQGTGPAARPGAPVERSLRNIAYALLSGADGWMFDGEDALGQVSTMSLDNQRNLALALSRDPVFLKVAAEVAAEMNAWSRATLGREIVADPIAQLGFTVPLFRARGLHLDDRHVRWADGAGFSASIVDAAIYVANNRDSLAALPRPVVLYLPKIQTAEEAALWHDLLSAIERHAGLAEGAITVYVLVEQLEACYQLMEIRAALGRHFVGFNTGRWDYINSVSDALAWDPAFQNPNIDAITMTYAYMAAYEDRVRRAVNTPDRSGRTALWQGGMEPNIPVGSTAGVEAGMARAAGRRAARAGGRGQRQVGGALEDGAHRAAGVGAGRRRQPARPQLPAAHLHRRRRGAAAPAHAGGAHRARRPRSHQRGGAVRQRLRPGPAGRGAEAGRLLRRRRRALPDGGHGHRRDPGQHPVGVAAQAGALHRGRRGDRRPRRRHR